jgi:hypothetical protein
MDDVLSHGMDREPNRLRRLLVTLAITCCLVVALVMHVASDHERSGHRATRPATHAILAVGPVQLAGLGAAAASLLNGSAQTTTQALTHYPGPSPTRWWHTPRKRLPRACRRAARWPAGGQSSRLCVLVGAYSRR